MQLFLLKLAKWRLIHMCFITCLLDINEFKQIFSDIVKHELRVTNHELQATSYYLRVGSLKAQVEIQKFESKSTSYELKSTSLNLRVTSSTLQVMSSNTLVTSLNPRITSPYLQVTSSNQRVTSSNPRVQQLINQLKLLKLSSFPKILSLKSFGNSWGSSYIQFLAIISCFTFSLFHGYGFRWKESE